MYLKQLCKSLEKCPPWSFPTGLAIWIKPESLNRIPPDNMDWMNAECMLTWPDMEMGDEWIIWHEISTKESFSEIVFILPQQVLPIGAQRCYEILVNKHYSKEKPNEQTD